MRAPLGSKFFQFHAVFCEILAKSYVGTLPPGELAPPPREIKDAAHKKTVTLMEHVNKIERRLEKIVINRD